MTNNTNTTGPRLGGSLDYGVAPPSGHRLPSATRVGPIRLRVADVPRSTEFYDRVLGLKTLRQDAKGASLGVPDQRETLIELVERPGATPAASRGRIGLYHFAVRVPNRASLARFVLHANNLGLRIGMSDHLVSEAIYLSDVDGIGIEVYADRPRNTWKKSGNQLVMRTDPLDLDDLLSHAGTERYAGVPDGTDMGHVHFHVGDLDRASRFYHEALGLDKIVWNYPGALFLSAGGYHHHVGMNIWAAHAPPAGPDDAGLVSWTLVLPDSSAVEQVVARVQVAGFSATPEGDRWLARDPWGITVAIVSDDRGSSS